jgi:hypothetical protein
MSRYICFIDLKHLIFINGGSIFEVNFATPSLSVYQALSTKLGKYHIISPSIVYINNVLMLLVPYSESGETHPIRTPKKSIVDKRY